MPNPNLSDLRFPSESLGFLGGASLAVLDPRRLVLESFSSRNTFLGRDFWSVLGDFLAFTVSSPFLRSVLHFPLCRGETTLEIWIRECFLDRDRHLGLRLVRMMSSLKAFQSENVVDEMPTATTTESEIVNVASGDEFFVDYSCLDLECFLSRLTFVENLANEVFATVFPYGSVDKNSGTEIAVVQIVRLVNADVFLLVADVRDLVYDDFHVECIKPCVQLWLKWKQT